MIRRTLAAAFALAVLTGCASTPDPEPIIRTVTVNVPVPVSCVPANANTEPTFRVSKEAVVAAPDAAERLRLVGAGFLERDAWIGEAVAVLRGCRDIESVR